MATQPQEQEQSGELDAMDLIKSESGAAMETLEDVDLLEATEPPLIEDEAASTDLDFKHDDPDFGMADDCGEGTNTTLTDQSPKDEPLACLEEKREALGSPGHQQEQESASPNSQQKEQELRAPSPLEPTTDARPHEQLSVLTAKADTGPEASTKLPVLCGNKRPPPTPVTSQSFSWNDILRVQNLIERCLQQYLSKHEILMALKDQANVEPDFTTVVWQKLEEQNPSFFRAYNLQLQLKEQILAFNFLVKQQREMMGGTTPANKYLSSTSRAPNSANSWSTSGDTRSFLQTPTSNSNKMPRTGLRPQQRPTDAAGNAFHLGQAFGSSSSLPLPSPIKSDLDTHAFFT